MTDPETAEYLQIDWEPVAESELNEQEAASGLLAKLTLKPGLPLGPINQTIRLTTNVQEAGTLELPVRGSVVSDISIVGSARFSEKYSVINFGTVDSAVGAKVNLRILIKGPHRHDVKIDLKSIEPAGSLTAELGARTSINNGAVYMVPLTVEVPKDAQPVNRLGSVQSDYGKVVLETTHPTAKTVPVYVKFAVK
jgi:hypothetical protein